VGKDCLKDFFYLFEIQIFAIETAEEMVNMDEILLILFYCIFIDVCPMIWWTVVSVDMRSPVHVFESMTMSQQLTIL